MEGLSKALEKARDNCTQLADMGVEKEMLEPFWQLMKGGNIFPLVDEKYSWFCGFVIV